MEEDRPERDGSSSRRDDLGAYIRHQRESARLSLRKLASLAGVSNPYLSQIERGLRKPSAEILQAIAKALEISSETLYVKAGILEEREVSEDVPTVIARDPYLTGPQRQALLEMYRSFRQLSELSAGRDAGGRDDPAADLLTEPSAPSDPDRSDEGQGGASVRPSRRQRLLDRVTPGDVDDDAVEAASHPEEAGGAA